MEKKEQVQILVATLEQVEKPTKWKDLVKLEPLKSNVGTKESSKPTPNSYRSIMSGKKYEGMFVREHEEVVFYGLTTNYKQEFENLFTKESNK